MTDSHPLQVGLWTHWVNSHANFSIVGFSSVVIVECCAYSLFHQVSHCLSPQLRPKSAFDQLAHRSPCDTLLGVTNFSILILKGGQAKRQHPLGCPTIYTMYSGTVFKKGCILILKGGQAKRQHPFICLANYVIMFNCAFQAGDACPELQHDMQPLVRQQELRSHHGSPALSPLTHALGISKARKACTA